MILVSVGPAAGALEVPRAAREISAAGHGVEVFLEPGAGRFVGPGAFSGPPGVVEAPSAPSEAVLFAPATAGTLARLAHGLQAGPAWPPHEGTRVFLAPDLDPATAKHPAVRRNLDVLRGYGYGIIPGRDGGMAEAGLVAARVLGGLGGPLEGLRVLVTAGGTREPLDSVRFIGNRSSGKMGLAVAREASRLGAEVVVVAANVGVREPGLEWRDVETVEQLRDEVLRLAGSVDALVMAAAVSDFAPASPVRDKIRRGKGALSVDLRPTADVLGAVREQNPKLFMVGFAATHGDPVPDARQKLASKGADLVVGNDISREGVGFGAEENEVYVVSREGERFVPRASKTEVARAILEEAEIRLSKERQG